MEQIYTEYGRFVITFENICYYLSKGIKNICKADGFQSKEEVFIEILLQGSTADPLTRKYKAVYIYEFSQEEDTYPEVARFCKIFMNAIQLRNSLAHGSTHQWSGADGKLIERFLLRHPKIHSEGFNENRITFEIQALIEINHNLQKLFDCVVLIFTIVKCKFDDIDYTPLLVALKKGLSEIEIKSKLG